MMVVCGLPLLARWTAELEHFGAEALCVVEMQIQSSLMTQTIKQQRIKDFYLPQLSWDYAAVCYAYNVSFLHLTLYFLFILFNREVSSLPVVWKTYESNSY